jgi:excisionase family DNA binding protein
MMKIAQEDLLTSQEAASYLKISNMMLWRLVQKGQLVRHKVHNQDRYSRADLDRFMAAHQIGPVLPAPVADEEEME